MSEQECRESFERYMSDDGAWQRAIERSGDGYRLMQAQSAWSVWQAACAAFMKINVDEQSAG